MRPPHLFRTAARAVLAISLVAAVPLAIAAAPVAGHGQTHTAPKAAERADKALRYRVVFNVTEASSDGKPNPTLAKVARFVNLLAEDGVRPRRGDVVAIVHGDATPEVMGEAAWRERRGTPHPSLDLIRRLRDAGVSVRVCSQALHSHDIPPAAVDAAVQVDVAAITTLANLQLRGWALIPE